MFKISHNKLLPWLAYLVGIIFIGGLILAVTTIWIFWQYGRDLPDYRQLSNYSPPVTTRVHAGDGSLLAEYAIEKRSFVPVSSIPKQLIHAFLSAEDKNYYQHPGIDAFGVLRALLTNVRNYGKGRRPVGASTITQQVAQNFLLTKEVSLKRKIREAIISFRMERVFSKDEILELYLNQIYLGFGSYGVAEAANNYFAKSLDQLILEEVAFLAALPKAPNNYNPRYFYKAAVGRRNYVIGRMIEDGYVNKESGLIAKETPLKIVQPNKSPIIDAPYFAETVRRDLANRYGDKTLYQGGLSVRTTLDPRLQKIAKNALWDGLVAYDKRHGWRGPYSKLTTMDGWAMNLGKINLPRSFIDWSPAVILNIDDENGMATIGFSSGKKGSLPLSEIKWARAWKKGQKLGPKVRKISQVLELLDIVLVKKIKNDVRGQAYSNMWSLCQIPDVNGAIIAIDPHTGRVLAMSGGLVYETSEFNRATQAWRQPGSAFKPFVYLAALDSGFTPSTLVLDAPFVIDQGPGMRKWKPANYSKKFYGPSPMRLGIEKSRNLMTVRLAQTVGIEKVIRYAEDLGVMDKTPRQLSISIGAGETTLLRLVTAYSIIVNGGKKITPSLIDRIQDRHGKTIFRHDGRLCDKCQNIIWSENKEPPNLLDTRAKILNPATAYQMVSMLQGVVERGTGVRVKAVGKPLAGKTGTTNDSMDTWFIGFSPDLAVGVFVGFDNPKPMGYGETGSSVSAPIFHDFMKNALERSSAIPFRVPPGIRLVRVNAATGVVAKRGDKSSILEAFKPGTEPLELGPVIDGGYNPMDQRSNSIRGIY